MVDLPSDYDRLYSADNSMGIYQICLYQESWEEVLVSRRQGHREELEWNH